MARGTLIWVPLWQRTALALRQRLSAFAFVFALVRDHLVVGHLTSCYPFSGISGMTAAPLLPANLACMSPSFQRPFFGSRRGGSSDSCLPCCSSVLDKCLALPCVHGANASGLVAVALPASPTSLMPVAPSAGLVQHLRLVTLPLVRVPQCLRDRLPSHPRRRS